MQYSYHDPMKNEMLKSTLFLQADILMLDWCIGSATQKEVGRLFGTMPQVSPTTIAHRIWDKCAPIHVVTTTGEVDCKTFGDESMNL